MIIVVAIVCFLGAISCFILSWDVIMGWLELIDIIGGIWLSIAGVGLVALGIYLVRGLAVGLFL